jgi:hypothetical protein
MRGKEIKEITAKFRKLVSAISRLFSVQLWRSWIMVSSIIANYGMKEPILLTFFIGSMSVM